MTTSNVPRVLVRAGERGPEFPSGHPYNPSSEVHGWLLSRPAGLARIAVNAAFLRPGKESAIFHVHYREEEWMYVLSGRGIAEVDGAEHAVGPGDFLGFAPGVGHHLRNSSGEELHYLVGGEVIADVEVADFPTVRRRAVFYRSRFAVYPMDAEVPFMLPEAEQAIAAILGSPRVTEPERALVRTSDRAEPRRYQHPDNPRSETHVVQLSRRAGLRRVAVNLARVPAGRESYVFHLHHAQEEWMYVLSGRGIAEVGEAEHEVGPGDFLGFPAGGPAHHLRNPSGEELVYLTGGDAFGGVEVVDFPRLGKRKVWLDSRRSVVYPIEPR